jgi:formamidopyrimidine-DNA glycosylase
MPELPEVESTVRYLRERIVGARIIDAQVRWARTVDRPGVRKFKENVIGRTVCQVNRRGKYIVMLLDSGENNRPGFLLSHLRMSGSMDVIESSSPVGKHDRLVLKLHSGKDIRFNDPRKFGRFYLVRDQDEVTGKLGLEPFDPLLTADEFHARLRVKRTVVKSLLLNQEFLAGVGNIYADEALWRSGLHPRRRAETILREEAALLLTSIQEILQNAIEVNGTDYGDGVVEDGLYEPKAYGRHGKPCERCRTNLKRIVVGQRGTHFCPKCQPLRRSRKSL